MNSKIPFKGTRWFKCDLHLHTTASLCFADRTVTAKQWVDRALEQGLQCVAVTDHNTGLSIDEIKLAASGSGLVVFPGVEITCDASKVHLLVLFDVTKTSADIRDFLVRADIKAEDFGKQNASTIRSIFEIAELANKDGALVIPAHIDEYNGLGSVSVDNLKKFFSSFNISAVQVVHRDFLNTALQTNSNTELKGKLNEYYNNPTPAIDDTTIKEWYTPVKYAIEANLAILTFSDNPHEPKNPKHGLLGIGSRYTWVKMDESPSLEGLRQAFLLPEFRVKNDFESPNSPYQFPELWIKSITIKETTLTDGANPFTIEFNPQLNTIIGGRGSGKSSVLRFIRGIFNRTTDIADLNEIINDHSDFYKKESGRPKKGVLKDNSVIEIEFVRNSIVNKITASNIKDSTEQEIKIERFIEASGSWENVTDEGYIDFFEFEHYSQKQIYEIAQEPNALRERIDNSIEGVDSLKFEREQIKSKFLEKSAAIRTAEQLISGKGRIETRIKDLDENINKLKQSGIAELLKTKEKFNKEEKVINAFKLAIAQKEEQLNSLQEAFQISDIDYSTFDSGHQGELKLLSQTVIEGIAKIKVELLKQKEAISKLHNEYMEAVKVSQWQNDYAKNDEEFDTKKKELESEGVDDIASFEKLTQEKADLENQLLTINAKVLIRDGDIREKANLQSNYVLISKQITEKRKGFVNHILQNGKVKINIRPFRNQTDFELRLRKIVQRESNAFQDDIDKLALICFTGNVEQKIQDVRNIFLKIRKGEAINGEVSGFFVNLVESLNDAQIDEIELLIPEDDIEVQYKPTNSSAFKSLTTASAGQKTAAILTFILSYGTVPLILDQPEDDLDNKLVYELIVDRLTQAKENRQLIIVTHNANVPVNGDAEFIVSMDTDSRTLKILDSGTLESESLKKEICNVMEGGELAFQMRSKRYKLLK